jgi:ketosteroid isomerase-like protein
MSQENVNLVRRIYAAWEQQESAKAFIDDAVEYVNPPYAVERGTRYGRKSFAAVRDTYDQFDVRIEEFVDAGEDVVVLAWFEARGRGSGVEVEGEHGYVWTVRDGKAVRFKWFQHHAEALEAAGVSE